MTVLLGRDAELAALESALGDARGGHGRLFLLAGEPGIGKTRLADELCARAGAGVRVTWGRCWEAGGAPAYWPWIESLRPLLSDLEPAALAAELGPAAGPLAALIPELRARLPGLPDVPRDDSPAARFLLFDTIARFLRAAAARHPLLLVLDDLHVADVPSLALLEFVARGLRCAPILVVGTYRAADARLSPEVATLLASVEREGQRFPLRRLRPAEVAAFIAEQAGSAPDEQTVAAVVRATEGTPLFVAEVVRLMLADAAPTGGGRALPSRVLVPDGVQPAIRGHLARVSDQTRAILRVGAVVGRDFTSSIVRGAMEDGGVTAAQIDEALGEARRAGLVEEIEGPGPGFRFSHMLVRETIYRDLGALERERLHGRVARAFESGGDASGTDRLAELSHHWSRAGAGGDPAKTVLYCRRAGERALHTFAHEEAAAHLRRALDAVAGDDGTADRARVEIGLLLAEAHQRCGDRVRATAACRDAATVARRLGDPALIGQVGLRLGAEFSFGVVDPFLVGLLEEALAGLGDAGVPLRARAMARLAAARQPAPDPDEPLQLAREALALARELGDRPTLAAVLRDVRAAYLPMDDLDERLALDLEALAVAYETGDKETALHAHWRLARERAEQGNIAAALNHLDQHDRLAGELKQGHRRTWTLIGRAAIASLRGDFAEADRFFDEADAILVTAQEAGGLRYLLLCRACHAYAATRTEEAVRHQRRLEQALADADTSDVPFMLAWTRAGAADGETLRAVADAVPWDRWPIRFSGQHAMAEIAARAGMLDLVAAFYERLLPWADRFTLASVGEGCYSHYLGVLARALGRSEDAARHFEHAIALQQKIGARPWVAQSSMAYADLLDRGGEADRRRAQALRSHARIIAEQIGMPGLLARLGVAPPAPAARPAPPSALSCVQEGEMWTFTFDGVPYRFRDSKGMQIIGYLIHNPGREFHVLHLQGIASGTEGGEALIEAPSPRGADASARAAYRARAEDVQDELREAEANHDLGRAEKARTELEALADELASATALGGRERKAGGSAERARVNIQRRISDALAKIEDACAPLARRLSRAIRTGAYCRYEAD